MTTINWASAASGTWSTASDWAGGVVPGAGDDAVINAVSQNHFSSYVVSILAPVTVHSLTIASRNAYVVAQSALTAGIIDLSAGHLETDSAVVSNLSISGGQLTLDPGASFNGSLTATGGRVTLTGASVSGSVTWLGGVLKLGAGTVFTNVAWHGLLAPVGRTVLTMSGGLALTGANGSGAGEASLGGLKLDQVTQLDNATITLTSAHTNLWVENSPVLTLGNKLVVQNANVAIAAGDTLVNAGTINGGGVSGDSFVNNGLIEGSFSDRARHFTNNGTIVTANGAVLTLPGNGGVTSGAQSAIDIAGGNLVLNGFLSTSSLLELYTADHITTSGSCGFAVAGLLNNDAATLSIGVGSQLGTIYGGATMSIIGGTIDDLGGAELGTLDLSYVTYAASGTATFATATFDASRLSGAASINARNLTLAQSTLTGVGTLNIGGSLDLEGASITGAGSVPGVAVNFSATYLGYLTIGAGQSVTGDTFTFGTPGGFGAGVVALAGCNRIDGASFTFNGGFQNSIEDSSATANATLGAHVGVILESGELTILGQGQHGAVVNEGTMSVDGELAIGLSQGALSASTVFRNAGTINLGAGSALFIDPSYGKLINTGTIAIVGGALEASATDLVNQGALSVSNGTLVLDGKLGLANLTTVAHPGSELIIHGNLDLGGGSVGFGSANLQDFVLSGTVSHGALSVGAGQTLITAGFGLSYSATLATALSNDGTIVVTGGLGETDVQTLEITHDLSGAGTIALGAGPSDASHFILVKLDGSVASSQTLAFMSGYDGMEFGSIAAASGFAGTISGLGSAGVIEPSFTFDHATIASATIAGHAIDVRFSNGAHATLASAGALSGTVSFYNSQGNGILEYNQGGAAAHFWSPSLHG